MSETINGTATVHKVINERQTVYKLDPPYQRTVYDWDAPDGEEESTVAQEFVVASGATEHGYRSEVLVFPSDGKGITDFGEIGGSYAEEQGHVSALKGMGYRLAGDPEAIMETIRRSGRMIPKSAASQEHSQFWGY